jgi:hypothetical protein
MFGLNILAFILKVQPETHSSILNFLNLKGLRKTGFYLFHTNMSLNAHHPIVSFSRRDIISDTASFLIYNCSFQSVSQLFKLGMMKFWKHDTLYNTACYA